MSSILLFYKIDTVLKQMLVNLGNQIGNFHNEKIQCKFSKLKIYRNNASFINTTFNDKSLAVIVFKVYSNLILKC